MTKVLTPYFDKVSGTIATVVGPPSKAADASSLGFQQSSHILHSKMASAEIESFWQHHHPSSYRELNQKWAPASPETAQQRKPVSDLYQHPSLHVRSHGFWNKYTSNPLFVAPCVESRLSRPAPASVKAKKLCQVLRFRRVGALEMSGAKYKTGCRVQA